MQPLASMQQFMTWLSMCPANESTTLQQKRAYGAHTLAVLIVLVICLAASLAYCLEYYFIDFNGAAFALTVTIGFIGMIYTLIAGVLMRHQIVNIFTSLSTIYKSSKFIHS